MLVAASMDPASAMPAPAMGRSPALSLASRSSDPAASTSSSWKAPGWLATRPCQSRFPCLSMTAARAQVPPQSMARATGDSMALASIASVFIVLNCIIA